LSFADCAGFRCGTCYEFPVYDVRNRRALKLREKPLVVMDCSVIDQNYMGLGTGDQALEYIQRVINQCKTYKGDFIILWHNSRLVEQKEKQLYEMLFE
jgi:hypothetical protein